MILSSCQKHVFHHTIYALRHKYCERFATLRGLRRLATHCELDFSMSGTYISIRQASNADVGKDDGAKTNII